MNKKGFSLVEVLTAVALLALVLTVLMQIVPSMLQIGRKVEINSKLSFLAEQKIEEIISFTKSNHVSYGFNNNYTQTATAFAAPDTVYKFTISDDQNANLKTLSITVWKDVDNNNVLNTNEHSFILDTKVVNRN
ncbi:prepilin-type N-terminal cleavage/methylation domain-containing protein [bacterium]|jgi:prepilin-type N-terminal cleavage/methylation domain-containing protein|nr:prepilin-type N-terminal cleavage/methylation domain-containing protein [bacterium]MBT3581615.1 prepilin-type N-terminal cleavage/methylation domain-containing protein [bacterium]MBT4552014.1 prepilin-type N-terminal cleavage/methylation domain-containing protein [bacterium]